jgi:DNA-binding NtrC family response regulator
MPPASNDAIAPDIVAESPAMRELMDSLARVAPTDATILLVGETGTGKEVLARKLHASSRRSARAFVPVNCGALPEALVESELFGHIRGAFTGAATDRIGLFEEASGGTLFLDEIGELPLQVQVRLLRALQERTIRRVGDAKERPVDVRLVAATHRDLAAMVAAGTFREDLLYRLQVVTFRLPPLRERRADLPVLTAQLLGQINRQYNRSCVLSADALALIHAQRWPGNVRELRHFLEQVVVLAGSDVVGRSEVELRLRGAPGAGKAPGAGAAAPLSGVTRPSAPTKPEGSTRRWALGWWAFKMGAGPNGEQYVRPLAGLPKFDLVKSLASGDSLPAGRDADRAQLVLATDEISRLHATFAAESDTITVQDEGSRNGTFVDGQQLGPHVAQPLAVGAVVRFGKEWVGFVLDVLRNPDQAQAVARTIADRAAATWQATAIEVKAFERLLATRGDFASAGVSCEAGVVRLVEADDAVGAAEATSAVNLTADQVRQALEQAGGNKRQAARILGISPQTLYTKMRAFGL